MSVVCVWKFTDLPRATQWPATPPPKADRPTGGLSWSWCPFNKNLVLNRSGGGRGQIAWSCPDHHLLADLYPNQELGVHAPRIPPACGGMQRCAQRSTGGTRCSASAMRVVVRCGRWEEHTSELQSRGHLVCRLLLEK